MINNNILFDKINSMKIQNKLFIFITTLLAAATISSYFLINKPNNFIDNQKQRDTNASTRAQDTELYPYWEWNIMMPIMSASDPMAIKVIEQALRENIDKFVKYSLPNTSVENVFDYNIDEVNGRVNVTAINLSLPVSDGEANAVILFSGLDYTFYGFKRNVGNFNISDLSVQISVPKYALAGEINEKIKNAILVKLSKFGYYENYLSPLFSKYIPNGLDKYAETTFTQNETTKEDNIFINIVDVTFFDTKGIKQPNAFLITKNQVTINYENTSIPWWFISLITFVIVSIPFILIVAILILKRVKQDDSIDYDEFSKKF